MASEHECKHDAESQRDQRIGHVISENKPIDSRAPPHLNQTSMTVRDNDFPECVISNVCGGAFSWYLTQHTLLLPSALKNPWSLGAKRLGPLHCYHGDR